MGNLEKYQFQAVNIEQDSDTVILSQKIIESYGYRENLSENNTLEMIQVQGGKFIMGTPQEEEGRSKDETPTHEVTIADFFVGKYPITQSQYLAVMKENPSFFQGENKPIENISWFEAQDFCQRLSSFTNRKYRLLSEAEWEYVCRGGKNTCFGYGKTITSELANYKAQFGYGQGGRGKWRQETTEVGTFPPNNFGLYDLHGNVWEWCEDHWHENYHQAPTDGKPWLDEISDEEAPRVIRGGSWDDTAYYCRTGVRLWALPQFKGKLIGFRVASDDSV